MAEFQGSQKGRYTFGVFKIETQFLRLIFLSRVRNLNIMSLFRTRNHFDPCLADSCGTKMTVLVLVFGNLFSKQGVHAEGNERRGKRAVHVVFLVAEEVGR